MFYEQFADEGDNTNLYMVDGDNRSSPGLQLVVFLSTTPGDGQCVENPTFVSPVL
jgi:hypothetical protein